MPESIRVQRDLAESVAPVMVDADQVQIVLDNLLSNAIQAMPDGGLLIVRTRSLGDRVQVEVEDTGIGISPEHLERIFEPLFTTKSKGIGLGLSLSERLVKANGGTIRVESTPGPGTRFVMEFGTSPSA
jgi:signal transduction histidine kinase